MISCPDCKKIISEKAASCVNCGCPITDVVLKQSALQKEIIEKNRRAKTNSWLAVCFVIMAIIAIVFGEMIFGDKKIEPLKTTEVIRNERIEKAFSAWDGSNRNLVKAVKSNMNDPSSFEHVETTYLDDGDYLLITMKFRGKNVFGAVVINQIEAITTLDGEIIRILE